MRNNMAKEKPRSDGPLGGGLIQKTLEDVTSSTHDISPGCTSVEAIFPGMLMGRDAEELFLSTHVFRGLTLLHPAWDSSAISYFTAEDFLVVIERCNALNVHIIGMEIFTPRGQLLEINIPEDDSNASHIVFVMKYQHRRKVNISATYCLDRWAASINWSS